MADIVVIIPAYNEENAIGNVINDIPKGLADEIVVVDNNSIDKTNVRASVNGATVLREERQGYGYACLKGMEYMKAKSGKPEVVVFLDADYSDHPEEMEQLVEPILRDGFDLVIGSRTLGIKEKRAMLPQQVFGNWLATRLLRLLYKAKYTDLGPFRAIRYDKLMQIGMRDTTYGWTVEMQLKAAKHGLKYCEVPVNYRKRIGKSKITGTLNGTLMAGYKIISTIFKYL